MKQILVAVFLSLLALPLSAQQAELVSGPEPGTATIVGIIADTDGSIIPGATITAEGATPQDRHTATSTGDGSFTVDHLSAAVPYHVVVHAKGFLDKSLPVTPLHAGEYRDLEQIQLAVGIVETTVSAVSAEELAIEQVKGAEKQRIFGVIPNFYVVYDQRFAPMSTKLKFELAARSSRDIVSIGGGALLAGINQASDSAPSYRQGAKGYAQRFGAAYGGGVITVFLGGAILPSILHQDPRYFYQGTGTRKSRALHAMSAPFRAKSDKGNWEFNYSSIGGDVISGALSNIYYPPRDRGPGLVFGGAAIATGGRIVNALVQEFFLHRVTTNTTPPD